MRSEVDVMRNWIRDIFWEEGQWDWTGIILKLAGGALVQLFKMLRYRQKGDQ
jgi:hypothetical protein